MAKKRKAADVEDGTPADEQVLEANNFAREANGVYQCQNCKMIPQDLRAEGSICAEAPSVSFVQDHCRICRGEVFDLTYCAGLMKDFISTETGLNTSVVIQPRFKNIIRVMVGDEESLVEVFTHGVEAVMKKKSDEDFATPGLYRDLPAEVDYAKVSQAFESFIVTTTDLFGNLAEFDLLVRFLQCICPALEVPQSVLEENASKQAKLPPPDEE